MHSENNYLTPIGTFQDKHTQINNLRNKNFLKVKSEG